MARSPSEETPTAEEPVRSGALVGVRVLDLSLSYGGGIAGVLLADYGAEVIRVVRGDVHRARQSAEPLPWDRGKRSITVDLGSTADVDLLRQLGSTADIALIEDDQLELARAGLDSRALRAEAPGLVTVALTGGEADCEDDIIAAARYGAMAASPGHTPGPTFLGHPAIAYSSGLLTVIGALAGLRHRLHAGEGAATSVGLDAAVLAQRTMQWWSERRVSYIQGRTANGDLDLGHRRMLLRRFECGDGALIQVHTGAQGAFGRFVELMGLADQVSAPDPDRPETATDLTDVDLEVLDRELPALMAARPAGEWLSLLWDAQVAALPLQAPAVAFTDPQVEHARLVIDVAGPDGDPRSVVGPPISFRHQPGAAGGRIPTDGDDNRAVREQGWTAPGLRGELDNSRGTGIGSASEVQGGTGPLAGLHLLEFSSWFAAAYGNRILSDLGAEVIKVEPVHGDPIRVMPDPFHAANHGKRSVAVDLKGDDAPQLLGALFRWADAVQHNFRPGTAERVGIDAASARGANPELVYSYAPGYGSTGPKSALQSFAPLLSGFVGIMSEATGGDHPPHQSFGNEDYYNGMLSAVGVLLGVIGRDRTGCADDIECPQLHSSLLATSHWFIVDGQPRSVLPLIDDEEMGWSAAQRIYQCLEGWLAISCRRAAEVDSLLRVVLDASPDPHDPAGTDLAEPLAYQFFGRPALEWERDLRDAGVPCAVVDEAEWYSRYLLDDANLASGRVAELDLADHGRVRMVARLLEFDDVPFPERSGAPSLGADNEWVHHSLLAGQRTPTRDARTA